MDAILLAFIGYTLGAIGRTVYGYLAKIIETNEPQTFDKKYWATMVSAIIISLLTAAATFTTVQIPQTDNSTSILLYTFAFGYMANSVINRAVSIVSTSKVPEAGANP